MKLPPLNFYKSPNKPTIFFFFFIWKKPCISTCQNHSSTHSLSLSTPIPLNPDSQNSFHSRIALPTNPPTPSNHLQNRLPSTRLSLHPRVNQPRQTRSQRSENKRPTSVSLVRELPPPNRVEIGIGYRTNREHGHGVQSNNDREGEPRSKRGDSNRTRSRVDGCPLLARGGRVSAWIGKAGGRGGVRPRRR